MSNALWRAHGSPRWGLTRAFCSPCQTLAICPPALLPILPQATIRFLVGPGLYMPTAGSMAGSSAWFVYPEAGDGPPGLRLPVWAEVPRSSQGAMQETVDMGWLRGIHVGLLQSCGWHEGNQAGLGTLGLGAWGCEGRGLQSPETAAQWEL